jgi:hypothetical protein
MAEKHYYYYKKINEKWENPQQAYYSFISGAMNYASLKVKEDKDFPKMLIITENKTPIQAIKINLATIKTWKKIRLKPDKEEKLNEYRENLVYSFEIKVEEKIEEGAFFLKWENPIGALFDKHQKLWDYIIRNRDKFKNKPKRIITYKKDTGEEIWRIDVNETFIENLKSSREKMEKIDTGF